MIRQSFQIFSNFYLGNVNDDLDFDFGLGATADFGCGVTFMDQYWYFGDQNKVNIVFDSNVLNFFQVSKIVGCRLERQADMPLTFPGGACNTFHSLTPIVLLCFASEIQGDGKDQACYT